MPWSVAIPAIASVVGGGLALYGAEDAAGNQNRQSQASLDFAKQQAAQQQANWQAQQDQLKAQWDARQKMLAPYNNAKLGMLAYYGLGGTSSGAAPMPANWNGQSPVTGSVPQTFGPSAQGFKPYTATTPVAPTSAPLPAGYVYAPGSNTMQGGPGYATSPLPPSLADLMGNA